MIKQNTQFFSKRLTLLFNKFLAYISHQKKNVEKALVTTITKKKKETDYDIFKNTANQ